MKFRFLPHIAVQIADRGKAVAFYSELMGMDLVDDKGGEARMSLDETHFYLEESEKGNVFFAFEVDDLEAAKALLIAHGARVWGEKDEGFMVRDPYGLQYHLSKAGSAS